MKETRKPGRPPKRTTKEGREAVASLARYWNKIGRKFSIHQLGNTVFGYHGGDTAELVMSILSSNGIPFTLTKAGRKPKSKPDPQAICTHFVVTTDMHA